MKSPPSSSSSTTPLTKSAATPRASVHSGNNSLVNNNTTLSLSSGAESVTSGLSAGSNNSSASSHLAIRQGNDHNDNNHSTINNIINNTDSYDNNSKDIRPRKQVNMLRSIYNMVSSIKFFVLLVLCLQNSMFTVLRRYSQGVLKEIYSKYEVLLLGEVIKMVFSAYMISGEITAQKGNPERSSLWERLQYLCLSSRKMVVLALIYGAMNILSFVSLRNIGAGMFTIIAQCKILTTAVCSTLMLKRHYSMTKWRALIALLFGVLLFSQPIWGDPANLKSQNADANPILGVMAVVIEVTLSGFASIYFEKVIKVDAAKHTIWERNFQLALASFPVYLAFITYESGGTAGLGGGWSVTAVMVSLLGAAGGLLVALSIKYGDAILKTLATTGAIILSSVLDHFALGGPLTSVMCIAAVQVVLSICNYTFDATPAKAGAAPMEASKDSDTPVPDDDEEIALLDKKQGNEFKRSGSTSK